MDDHVPVIGGGVNERIRPLGVIFKALILFIAVNLLYGWFPPPVAEWTVYNKLVPGLKRMPFGASNDPFTLTVDDVEVMFAAHEISAAKQVGEIRVALVGDSSIWGEALSNDETLAGQWNRANVQCGGKQFRFYNLGYPHPSIIKDLIFIEEALERELDVVVWFVTLNTLMNQYRLHPFILENRERALQVVERHEIPFAPYKALSEQEAGFFDQTLLGQRAFLARWLRLQALGLIWTATGEDMHAEPIHLETLARDVRRNPNYRDLEPGADLQSWLLTDALGAGYDLAGDVPVLLVNEPIFVAQGYNSNIRYNDLYPRWAYDLYREILAAQAQTSGLSYLDLWSAIPPEYFTDMPMHLNAEGERLLADKLNPTLLSLVCQ